jgi:hypothetical protein
MKVQGMFKVQTLTPFCAHARQHSVNSVGQWNVTCVGSIQRKTHVALPRYTANSEHIIGAMDESSGKVQDASTHIINRGVVMDIAAFKVCHSVGIDIDATALRAARARSSSTSIGAMDESSGKVQNASTHNKRCCHGCCSLQSLPLRRHGRHRPASRESEVKVHTGDG